MTTDPLGHWEAHDDPVTAPGDTDLALPARPRLRRCSSIRDVGAGPWIGTLACCTRPVGHDGPHVMSLGDPGSPTYWRESWA